VAGGLPPPRHPINVDGVTANTLLVRRILVRLALLFAVAQVIAAAGVLFALPALRMSGLGAALLVLLGVVDLVLLSIFATWIIRDAISASTEQLATDVHRIADGDYHHRVGDPQRGELKPIRDSVNRLADRLIADRKLLAANVRSLEETNRELVVLRDQMVHSARLASVGTLAAGIAHEVGNPLGAIIAFVDVAKARVSQAGGDTELLNSIRSEAERIDRIVRGLLDYARAPAAEARPARAADVLGDVRELLESQGKLEGVEVIWEVAEDDPDMVAEPRRLEQVMVNLLLNALDALEEADKPKLRVGLHGEEGEVTRLPARREGDPPDVNYMHRRRITDDEVGGGPVSRASRVTVIEVSDNGPGIPVADLERIFDPFFTTKEPGRGTGLGLSICARLVEGMGGQIEAGAAAEGGARFVIRLPGISDPNATTVVSSGSEALEAP
jgi:two-component system NtrC family sensor kinase